MTERPTGPSHEQRHIPPSIMADLNNVQQAQQHYNQIIRNLTPEIRREVVLQHKLDPLSDNFAHPTVPIPPNLNQPHMAVHVPQTSLTPEMGSLTLQPTTIPTTMCRPR